MVSANCQISEFRNNSRVRAICRIRSLAPLNTCHRRGNDQMTRSTKFYLILSFFSHEVKKSPISYCTGYLGKNMIYLVIYGVQESC